jgi:dolichol-phosphate mannosyltransferase
MAIDLAIIVPVFNEAENVLPLAREVAAAMRLETRAYELLFVDDGSTDATWERVREACRQTPHTRGLRLERNSGQSAALWSGLGATSSPLIATLDGDLQNDPAELPRLLAALAEADFVCGVRVKRQDHWRRRASARVARWARRWVLGVDFQDIGCALRVFRREVLGGVFPFNGLHRFLPVLVAGGGFRTRELPVNHRPRLAGVSKYGTWNRLGRGILDLLAVAWYQKRRLTTLRVAEACGRD